MSQLRLSGYDIVAKLVDQWKWKDKFSQYESAHSDWLMFVVADGSFYYRIGAQEGTAAYGDAIVCPPGTIFRRVVIHPVHLFVVFFDWRSDLAIGHRDKGTPSGFPEGKISFHNTERLATTLQIMSRIVECGDIRSNRRLEHYCQDLWLQYCAEQEEQTIRLVERGGFATEDSIVCGAIERMERQAFTSMKLKDVSASLNTSLSALSKRFKKAVGCTPIQYLTLLRMEKAETLLLETGLTVDQISECCGYQNGFYLSRVFIRHFGISPAQFRKKYGTNASVRARKDEMP